MDPVAALGEIAYRLERDGAESYKVRAFRNAATAISEIARDRLEAQHHPGAAAEGRGIHVAEGVPGIGAVAGSRQLMPQFPERPAGDADPGGIEQFGEEGEDIEAHGLLLAWPGSVRMDKKGCAGKERK